MKEENKHPNNLEKNAGGIQKNRGKWNLVITNIQIIEIRVVHIIHRLIQSNL